MTSRLEQKSEGRAVKIFAGSVFVIAALAAVSVVGVIIYAIVRAVEHFFG